MENTGFVSGAFVAFVLALTGISLLATTRNHRSTLRLQIGIFLAAFAIRYLMSLVIYEGGLINVLKDEDGSGWIVGTVIQQGWAQQDAGLLEIPGLLLEAYTQNNRGYYYLLALLYSVIEPARLPAAALNCFFGSLMIVFAYRIAETLFTPWVAKRVGLWLCVFPSMIIWSAQTIKEPVVMFLEVLALYSCIRMRRAAFSPIHLILCLVCILLMIPFRFYAGFVTIATVIVAAIVPKVGQGRFKLGPVFGGVMIVGFILSSGVLASKSASTEQYDLKYLENYRKNLAQGGSGVQVDVDIQSPAGMGVAMLVGAAHLLLAPFPWQLAGGGMRTLMVGPEMLFWWWLFFWGVVPGFLFAIRRRFTEMIPILIFLSGFGMLYSVMFGNVGLVYRQRAQLLPALLLFAGAGLERRKLRKMAARRPAAPPPGMMPPPWMVPPLDDRPPRTLPFGVGEDHWSRPPIPDLPSPEIARPKPELSLPAPDRPVLPLDLAPVAEKPRPSQPGPPTPPRPA